jgi:hypothetical protein
MAFGFPAGYEETRSYNIHPDYLAPAVSQALTTLGWLVIAYSPYQYQVKFPFSFLSYGENMAITIFQDGSINAKSECSFVLQWYDYNKNKKHIDEFFNQITAVSGYQPLAQPQL